MPDREKVIKGLEVCIDREPGEYSCYKCPYEIDANDCEINLSKDALSLLKEQEPVEPVPEHPVVINTLACGVCNAQVARWDIFPRMSLDANRAYLFKAKFCPECGRAVKWE